MTKKEESLINFVLPLILKISKNNLEVIPVVSTSLSTSTLPSNVGLS
jgi:hypothetical protein